jgi:NADH:ubiquinone oxidoreductase subunit C
MKPEFEQALAELNGGKPAEKHHDGWWLFSDGSLDMTVAAKLMIGVPARLMTVTGRYRADGETDVIYHFDVEKEIVNLSTHTHGQKLPSITPLIAAANWIEREIHDLYGVTFEGHPQPDRLIRPPQIPEGLYREQGGKPSAEK